MKRSFSRKSVTVFLASFAAFFVTTVLANKYLTAFDVSSVRISAALNPVLGITFGWPAIFGCAAANFLSDLVSGWGLATALMGFPAQILYGFLPYFFWRRYIRCESHITRLDSPKKVLVYLLITFLNSVCIGLAVGLIQYAVARNAFLRTAFFAFLNDFNVCVFFGLPLLALFDFLYSRYTHSGRRKLSANEIIILISALSELLAFAVIAAAVQLKCRPASLSVEDLWGRIFLISTIANAVITLLSLLAMAIFSALRKKHAGLRVIEKPNGTIFVDEKRRMEFVSFPGQAMEYRVKADSLGYTLENARKVIAPTYENAWYTLLSNQKGCPMKCLFCDCPGYGFYGNLTVDDLRYQIRTILENTGSTHTRYFSVDFMRMGEPTLNPAILEFTEHHLVPEIRSRVDADVIVPSLSTMLPRNKKAVTDFLQNYCRIKNEVYNGDAELQFSICTTDEEMRRRIFRNLSLSLEEIAEIGRGLPMPKGGKYRLNFPVTRDTVIDPAVIDRLFDKNRFCIKLTPIHSTFNAADNGFRITSEYDSYEVFAAFEKSFLDIGWDVLVYLDRKGEDDDGLTCGNLLLPNIRNKLTDTSADRKRIGLVVAIELNAIFERYGSCRQLESPAGFKLFLVERDRYSIYIAQSGMGECAASAACQFLISKCGVSKIINFGVVGGLTSDMKQLKVCLVDRVVHYKYDCSEFMPLAVGQVDGYDSIYIKTNENLVKTAQMLNSDLTLVTCCSGDKFIGTAEEKTFLHETFHGDICDMESAGIVLTCDANRVPCILFKAVSDGLADGAEGFYAELDNASRKCLQIADQIMDRIADFEA